MRAMSFIGRRGFIGAMAMALAMTGFLAFAQSAQAAGATGKTAATKESKTDAAKKASDSSSNGFDLNSSLGERVMGNPDAPVTMIEYASLNCPHCAHFHDDILPKIKKAYIDTGKVKLVFRDFPLNGVALKAAMIARCAPADKYFDLVAVIFANQDRWATADDPVKALSQLGELAGMSSDTIHACLSSNTLENALLKRMKDAQDKWKVEATPTFIFNYGEEQFSGAMPFDYFKQKIDSLLSKAKK